MNKQYHINFEQLCLELDLGTMTRPPQRITGGLIHRLYKLTTHKNIYSVKALNPNIVTDGKSAQKFSQAEQIAMEVQKHNISCLCASTINGNIVHNINGQYYIVFSWIPGSNITQKQINRGICFTVGSILGNIHTFDFSQLHLAPPQKPQPLQIDWISYTARCKQKNLYCYELLQDNIGLLSQWQSKGNQANAAVSANQVISHKDLDIKNVLWNHGYPTIIDWESAGYVNPLSELIRTALYWSGYIEQDIQKELLLSVINGYSSARSVTATDWEEILYSVFYEMLGWLEFNIQRALHTNCADVEEQQTGVQQCQLIMLSLLNYWHTLPEMKHWLKK